MDLQTEKTRLQSKVNKVSAKLEKAKTKAVIAADAACKTDDLVNALQQQHDYLVAQLKLIEEHTKAA